MMPPPGAGREHVEKKKRTKIKREKKENCGARNIVGKRALQGYGDKCRLEGPVSSMAEYVLQYRKWKQTWTREETRKEMSPSISHTFL